MGFLVSVLCKYETNKQVEYNTAVLSNNALYATKYLPFLDSMNSVC